MEGENYFMQEGEAFSYLGSYEEIGNIRYPWDERTYIIPGVYVLNIFKRHSVIDQGEAVFTNSHFDDGHKIGESRLKDI